MHIQYRVTSRLLMAGLTAALLGYAAAPAQAASKEIIELQSQVQQLSDSMQRLQSTLDAKFGVLQHMAEQTTDNANRMASGAVSLDKKLSTETDSINAKLDTVSGQAQAINDSVDELKLRIAKLEKALLEAQGQAQSSQAPPPMPGAQSAPNTAHGAAPGGQAPPLQETFQAGVRDYNAAKYEVAVGEFQDVIHYYPMDDLAGSAQYYLGEIAYRKLNYADAVKAYDAVLQGFPGSAKAPAAQLRKGLSLLALGKKPQGEQELRSLVGRYPHTPEAAQARQKLNALGVSVKPSAGR